MLARCSASIRGCQLGPLASLELSAVRNSYARSLLFATRVTQVSVAAMLSPLFRGMDHATLPIPSLVPILLGPSFMRHIMSEARAKISGRFFNIHLKHWRLGPSSMDRTRRQYPFFSAI